MHRSTFSAATALAVMFSLTAFLSTAPEASTTPTTVPTIEAIATISGLSTVAHRVDYGGCWPSYNLSGGTATGWSISGKGTLGGSSSTYALVGTTGFGSFTLTAHLSGGGTVSKTVSVVNSQDEWLCP